MSRRLARLRAPLGVALFALACAEVGDPDGPTSMAFGTRQLPAPAILLRDTLRDTLGQAAPLEAIVYDADDRVLPDVPVTYEVLDTAGVVRDAETGYVVSRDSNGLRTVRIQAQAAGLVSGPLSIAIIPAAPDTLRDADSASTTPLAMTFVGTATAATTTRPLRAVVRAGTAPVGLWFVEFRVVDKGGRLDSAWFTRSRTDTVTRAALQVDTTDASGIAERWVRGRAAPGAPNGTDSALVRARFRVRGAFTDSVDFHVPVVVGR